VYCQIRGGNPRAAEALVPGEAKKRVLGAGVLGAGCPVPSAQARDRAAQALQIQSQAPAVNCQRLAQPERPAAASNQ
jgi:hypothetical protein